MNEQQRLWNAYALLKKMVQAKLGYDFTSGDIPPGLASELEITLDIPKSTIRRHFGLSKTEPLKRIPSIHFLNKYIEFISDQNFKSWQDLVRWVEGKGGVFDNEGGMLKVNNNLHPIKGSQPDYLGSFLSGDPQFHWWGISNEVVYIPPFFEKIVLKIESRLTSSSVIVSYIIGRGGIGKSLMAKVLAHRFSDKYSVYWVDGFDLGDFLDHGKWKNLAQDEKLNIVFIDRTEFASTYVRSRLLETLNKIYSLGKTASNLKLVLVDREYSSEYTPIRFLGTDSVVDLDSDLDTQMVNEHLIELLSEHYQLPNWAEAIKTFQKGSFRLDSLTP